MIIASETNHYKKDNDLRLVKVEIYLPTLNDQTWECNLQMKGYGEINQTHYGQTSMQSLTFAMQHAKLNLVQMVNDGYQHFDITENKLLSVRETFELLNSMYGTSTLLDEAHMKTIYLQIIYRLQHGIGSEEEQNIDINYLKNQFADPEIVNYIYHNKSEMNEIEIYEKAMSYKPIII
jgi:hypothetical protein